MWYFKYKLIESTIFINADQDNFQKNTRYPTAAMIRYYRFDDHVFQIFVMKN